jgi:hypothetical protein
VSIDPDHHTNAAIAGPIRAVFPAARAARHIKPATNALSSATSGTNVITRIMKRMAHFMTRMTCVMTRTAHFMTRMAHLMKWMAHFMTRTAHLMTRMAHYMKRMTCVMTRMTHLMK